MSFSTRQQAGMRDHHDYVLAWVLVALAMTAVAIRAFVPASDPRSPFLGTWSSTELDFPESSQTMSIRAAEDGALDIALHDDSNLVCSTRHTRVNNVDTPSTLTGTGRLEDATILEDATTLVVPSPVLACADGRLPTPTGFAEEGAASATGWSLTSPPTDSSYTLVLDLATDRLFDNLGVAWHRGATPENGADTTTRASERTGPGIHGPGTFSFLYGEVTFHAGRPWGDHFESYLDPRIFWLIGGLPDFGLSDDASIEILANPKSQASCDTSLGVPASAEELVRAIRSNPDLDATAPVAERVGGVDALRLDVAAAPGTSRCVAGNVPVVSVYNRESAWGTLDPGDLGRLYVLDLPGGSIRALVIMITAPQAVFEQTVRAAAPVVDSFKFHTG